jgi:CheY-like chemotaxis protein
MNAYPLILVAEDERLHTIVLEKTLKRMKVTNPVQSFAHGGLLLAFLRGEEDYHERVLPDKLILIIDLNMPKVDGFALMEALNADPLWKAYPRIILSTSDDMDDMNRAQKLGYEAYFIKPPPYEELLAVIRKYDPPVQGE